MAYCSGRLELFCQSRVGKENYTFRGSLLPAEFIKVLMSFQNGWPSKHYDGVEPNSPDAVSSVASEQGYYKTLDSHCADLKAITGGGVGWFWHIYRLVFDIYKNSISLILMFSVTIKNLDMVFTTTVGRKNLISRPKHPVDAQFSS